MKLTSGETENGVKRLKLSTVKKISRAEIALVIEEKEQIHRNFNNCFLHERRGCFF